jgi:iron-sulfur cluster assembly protein
VGVRTTGCSGLAYVLEYVDAPLAEDQRIDCEGCTIFVDPKSCPYLQGVVIDYVRNGLNEGFEFRNPNERDRCGCGESFRV